LEKRYGRRNEKYRTKLNKKTAKPGFEKVIAFQTIICAILLVAGIVVSYADRGGSSSEYIKEVLYTSNTIKDWENVFSPVLKTAKKTGTKTVSLIDDGKEYLSKKLSINFKANNAPVKANADKKESAKEPERIEKKKSKETKTPETDESEAEETEEPKEEGVVFRIPTYGEITSPFGTRLHPVAGGSAFHTGIDIAAPMGQTVISAAKGQVLVAGSDNANGNYIIIKHSEEFTTSYAHLSRICVVNGEWVDGNTKIGEVGSSGVSTGPHLHFEIKQNGERVNPEEYITLPHRKGE